MIHDVRIMPDASAIARATAEHILDTCSRAISSHSVAYLALAGGETPRPAYSLLSQPEFASRMGWSRLHVFWSDERIVPPGHANSNYRVAAEALLGRVPIPPENIHRMRGELDPAKAAQDYEAEIRSILSPGADGFPCFDLMMVGMGDDGHIASLFPGSPALLERYRWAVATDHNQPPPPLVPRLTLTLPVINAADQVLVVVSGEKKAERLRQIIEEEPAGEPLPAQLLKPLSGRLTWLLDVPAASRLKQIN